MGELLNPVDFARLALVLLRFKHRFEDYER
jgi:hypothetical protein